MRTILSVIFILLGIAVFSQIVPVTFEELKILKPYLEWYKMNVLNNLGYSLLWTSATFFLSLFLLDKGVGHYFKKIQR